MRGNEKWQKKSEKGAARPGLFWLFALAKDWRRQRRCLRNGTKVAQLRCLLRDIRFVEEHVKAEPELSPKLNLSAPRSLERKLSLLHQHE